MKAWSSSLNMKIMLNMSLATGSVSSGNLLALDVICSKVHKIVGNTTGDTQLLILLPMETREVAYDNNIAVMNYSKTLSPDFCRTLLN